VSEPLEEREPTGQPSSEERRERPTSFIGTRERSINSLNEYSTSNLVSGSPEEVNKHRNESQHVEDIGSEAMLGVAEDYLEEPIEESVVEAERNPLDEPIEEGMVELGRDHLEEPIEEGVTEVEERHVEVPMEEARVVLEEDRLGGPVEEKEMPSPGTQKRRSTVGAVVHDDGERVHVVTREWRCATPANSDYGEEVVSPSKQVGHAKHPSRGSQDLLSENKGDVRTARVRGLGDGFERSVASSSANTSPRSHESSASSRSSRSSRRKDSNKRDRNIREQMESPNRDEAMKYEGRTKKGKPNAPFIEVDGKKRRRPHRREGKETKEQ
jgi:hypothetical protein